MSEIYKSQYAAFGTIKLERSKFNQAKVKAFHKHCKKTVPEVYDSHANRDFYFVFASEVPKDETDIARAKAVNQSHMEIVFKTIDRALMGKL